MEIKEYDYVCEGENSILLDEMVNEKIKEGWQPLGGIAVDSRGFFAQAIVKYETDKE